MLIIWLKYTTAKIALSYQSKTKQEKPNKWNQEHSAYRSQNATWMRLI